VGQFVIPCDFIVMDIAESSQVPIILGRLLLATAGAVIDVQASTLSFQFCGKRVDFRFPQTPSSAVSAASPPPEIPVRTVSPDTVSTIKVFDGDWRPRMRFGDFSDIPTAFLSYAGGTILHLVEESTALTTPTSLAPHFFTLSLRSQAKDLKQALLKRQPK